MYLLINILKDDGFQNGYSTYINALFDILLLNVVSPNFYHIHLIAF